MEYYYETSDELCHYGRKGMRWGQHIFGKVKAARTARKRKANLKKAREARAKRQADLKSGKISPKQMTDKELKSRIERLQLEKQLKDLKKNTNSRGKNFVVDVLEASGKNVMTQLTTYVMGSTINKVAKEAGVKNATKTVKGDDNVEKVVEYFEDIVNPRKGQKDK